MAASSPAASEEGSRQSPCGPAAGWENADPAPDLPDQDPLLRKPSREAQAQVSSSSGTPGGAGRGGDDLVLINHLVCVTVGTVLRG